MRAPSPSNAVEVLLFFGEIFQEIFDTAEILGVHFQF
jgi:hypothetical protein